MKAISINDTDKAVAQFLKDNHIHFSSRYMGFNNKDGWNSDKWLVKIGLHEFEYNTGLGHRISHSANSYKLSAKQIESVKVLRDLLGNDRLDNTVFKLSDGNSYAVSPTQASVLYCLLSDANCAEQNFNDFCSDLGYDNDSMKAFKIYQACCDTLEKMRKIFTAKQRAELSELLQDY